MSEIEEGRLGKADRATHEPSPDGLGHTVGIPDVEEWAHNNWPLDPRCHSLPKWAQEELKAARCSEINNEMEDCVRLDTRNVAKAITGGNCAFADDDIRLLAILARNAADAGLTDGISCFHTLRGIKEAAERRCAAQAIEARRAETTGSACESAVHEGNAPPTPRPHKDHNNG